MSLHPAPPNGSVAAADRPLSAHGLGCRRGERVLFRDLSFSIAAGEVCVVRGANGSGKSSLLRILARLLPPATGRVDGPEALHHCGHAHGLAPGLTLRRNLSFWSGLLGGDPMAAIEAVGLHRALDVPASALSAGQRQRAALARLLMSPRPLWLLDEPTAALDADGASLVVGLLNEHARAGGIAVVATHRTLDIGAPVQTVDLTPRTEPT